MSSHSPSTEQALDFVKTKGIVLESAHGRVPTFTDFVAGERVSGWWSHPKSQSIFALTRFIRDSPSGSIARRAGIGFVPIFFFQAGSWPEGARRFGSSPTGSRVLLGGSEIMVVIRFAASIKTARSG